ncbi:hypothetical protein [Pseudanabaena sp. UWO311]
MAGLIGICCNTAVNQWLFSEYDEPNVTISLQFLDLPIRIADLYDNIEFI